MNKFLFLEVSHTPEKLKGDNYDHPFYDDLMFLNEDDKKNIGFSDDDNIFVTLEEVKLNYFLYTLKKHGFKFTEKDIAKDVISGAIEKEYPEVSELTPNLFNNFKIKNYTKDDVLDKILELGIKSIDNIDKLILSN